MTTTMQELENRVLVAAGKVSDDWRLHQATDHNNLDALVMAMNELRDLVSLPALVEEMLDRQKTYFADRTKANLHASLEVETQVRRIAKNYRKRQEKRVQERRQPSLLPD